MLLAVLGRFAYPTPGDLLWVIKIRMPFLERRCLDEGYHTLAIGQRNTVLIKTRFINAKCLSSALVSSLLWRAANKTRSPFPHRSNAERLWDFSRDSYCTYMHIHTQAPVDVLYASNDTHVHTHRHTHAHTCT